MEKRNVYLDNAATTEPYPEVITAMVEAYAHHWQNPSAIYQTGADAYDVIRDCKQKLLSIIGADEDDKIIITSGGSEADNLAIKGVASYYDAGHIITSAIEHKAILNACHYLEGEGYSVTYLQPDERGMIDPANVKKAIRDDTILVSIMAANNEIGTIQQIEHIGKICEDFNVLFHVDAVQAFGHMPINVKKWKADMISVSAHKFHGPKGIGFLYLNQGDRLNPIIHGGKQEYGLRAGTENLPSIVGMTIAAEKATKDLHNKIDRMSSNRDYFIEQVIEKVPKCKFNGSLISRLCNNVSFSFDGIAGEQAVTLLDMYGVRCSNGSACNSGNPDPSHVLTAIGLTPEKAHGTLRFTIDESTTVDDIDYTVVALTHILRDLRQS